VDSASSSLRIATTPSLRSTRVTGKRFAAARSRSTWHSREENVHRAEVDEEVVIREVVVVVVDRTVVVVVTTAVVVNNVATVEVVVGMGVDMVAVVVVGLMEVGTTAVAATVEVVAATVETVAATEVVVAAMEVVVEDTAEIATEEIADTVGVVVEVVDTNNVIEVFVVVVCAIRFKELTGEALL